MSTVTDGLISGLTVNVFQSTDTPSVVWTITDSAGAAIDLSGGDVTCYVYERGQEEAVFTKSTTAVPATIVVSGASNNIVTMTYTQANVAISRVLEYRLFFSDGSGDRLIASGSFNVLAAAMPPVPS